MKRYWLLLAVALLLYSCPSMASASWDDPEDEGFIHPAAVTMSYAGEEDGMPPVCPPGGCGLAASEGDEDGHYPWLVAGGTPGKILLAAWEEDDGGFPFGGCI